MSYTLNPGLPPLPGCNESVILGKIKIKGINIAKANILYTEDIFQEQTYIHI